MAENKSTSTKLEWGVILGSKSGRVTSGFNAMDSLKNNFSKIKMAVSQPCFEIYQFFLPYPYQRVLVPTEPAPQHWLWIRVRAAVLLVHRHLEHRAGAAVEQRFR